MKYFLIILITVFTLFIHWHYYRWCIYNIKINRPNIYLSPIGDLLFFLSKVLLFGVILYFFNWYLVFIPIVVFQVLKEIAFNHSLMEVKKRYISDGLNETESLEMAKRQINNYHKYE